MNYEKTYCTVPYYMPSLCMPESIISTSMAYFHHSHLLYSINMSILPISAFHLFTPHKTLISYFYYHSSFLMLSVLHNPQKFLHIVAFTVLSFVFLLLMSPLISIQQGQHQNSFKHSVTKSTLIFLLLTEAFIKPATLLPCAALILHLTKTPTFLTRNGFQIFESCQYLKGFNIYAHVSCCFFPFP